MCKLFGHPIEIRPLGGTIFFIHTCIHIYMYVCMTVRTSHLISFPSRSGRALQHAIEIMKFCLMQYHHFKFKIKIF